MHLKRPACNWLLSEPLSWQFSDPLLHAPVSSARYMAEVEACRIVRLKLQWRAILLIVRGALLIPVPTDKKNMLFGVTFFDVQLMDGKAYRQDTRRLRRCPYLGKITQAFIEDIQ